MYRSHQLATLVVEGQDRVATESLVTIIFTRDDLLPSDPMHQFTRSTNIIRVYADLSLDVHLRKHILERSIPSQTIPQFCYNLQASTRSIGFYDRCTQNVLTVGTDSTERVLARIISGNLTLRHTAWGCGPTWSVDHSSHVRWLCVQLLCDHKFNAVSGLAGLSVDTLRVILKIVYESRYENFWNTRLKQSSIANVYAQKWRT